MGSYVERVRDRAPLRLSVSVQTPDGRDARWGWDDPNPENVPTALSFSSAMPGGFERMSCTLERDSRLAFPDTQELSTVTVQGAGGQVAWQGRLDKVPDTGGFQQQETVECVGFQAAFEDDNSAREVYVDIDLTHWEAPSLDRRKQLIEAKYNPSGPSVAPDPNALLPAVEELINAPWEPEPHPIIEAWYDAKGLPIGGVYYEAIAGPNINLADLNWFVEAYLTNNVFTSEIDEGGNLHGKASFEGFLAAKAANRVFALLQLVYGTGPVGGDTSYTYYWQKLAVLGSHGLITHGAPPGGLFASDVTAHAIGKWAQEISFTTGAEGTIQPSLFPIPHLVFLDPTNVAEIVKQATRFELLDWAVWEGPTYYQNERGARGKRWRARVAPAQLQEAGPQVARLWNGVVVAFTDVSGATRTVGPPGSGANVISALLEDPDPENPLNQAGIRRWAPLKMGTSTPAGAEQVGARFLRESRTLDTSGQASLVGHVEDDSGIFWPAWMVRAGDTVEFVDAAITSPRRIVHADYADDTKTCTVQLDQPPDSMTALLERLNVVLVAVGIG